MPKLTKPTPKQRAFAEAYCNEARGSVAKAYESVAEMGVAKLKQKETDPEAYKGYTYRQGYIMLNHPMTLKAIGDVKLRKSRSFWLSEEDILSGLYKEAINIEDKSTQAARIQAWVWLGKHIGMFGEASKSKALNTAEAANKGSTYNIINYQSTSPDESMKVVSEEQKIVDGVNKVKDQIEQLDSPVEESLAVSNLVNIKDFS